MAAIGERALRKCKAGRELPLGSLNRLAICSVWATKAIGCESSRRGFRMAARLVANEGPNRMNSWSGILRAARLAVAILTGVGAVVCAEAQATSVLHELRHVDRVDDIMPPGSTAVAPSQRPATQSATTRSTTRSAPATTTRTTTVSGRTGDVILLRGLMDVFSYGMDALGAQLQEKGFQAQVLNHSNWQKVADEIVRRYKATRSPEPVFLIGHSLGADAVILLSERLAQEKVPVALVVTFDPVHPREVPINVRRLVNFYQSNNGWGVAVKPREGSKSILVNKDLKDRTDISHTTIDKADFLHAEVVNEMIKLSRPVRRRVAG